VPLSQFDDQENPEGVVERCEWGEDDYSLQVENLPKAPPPKGQMELIAEDGAGTTQSRSIGERDLRNEVR